MKTFLAIVAICAAIIAIVFGALGEIVGLTFISSIAYLASVVLTICIYGIITLWVISFDWSEAPFLKATFSGTLMSVASISVFAIFDWQLFHTLFVIFAIITGIAIVIGLIKTIFSF